ncbi:MAG TPA: TRAP transporter small permease [Acidobacteriota bacterium]|nr:TRAP transporter small permease [Acidobacteriota bacterium]
MERLNRRLMQLERLAAVALLAAVLGLMAAQVAARYAFHAPIAWSEELARFALIWLAFISAAFVAAEGRHIAVDMVSARLEVRGKLVLDCVGSLATAACCIVLIVGSWGFVFRVGAVASPALGIPMSWWYASAGVGLGLIAHHVLLNLVRALRSRRPTWSGPAGEADVSPADFGDAT